MMIDDTDALTIFLVNAASGLSLGLSVTVLGDLLPWKWASDRPWIVMSIMLAAWVPLVLFGVPEVRRVTNMFISLYISWLFVMYGRKETERRESR